jgi:hypothetical protein
MNCSGGYTCFTFVHDPGRHVKSLSCGVYLRLAIYPLKTAKLPLITVPYSSPGCECMGIIDPGGHSILYKPNALSGCPVTGASIIMLNLGVTSWPCDAEQTSTRLQASRLHFKLMAASPKHSRYLAPALQQASGASNVVIMGSKNCRGQQKTEKLCLPCK